MELNISLLSTSLNWDLFNGKIFALEVLHLIILAIYIIHLINPDG
jgi:hypothetical protein